MNDLSRLAGQYGYLVSRFGHNDARTIEARRDFVTARIAAQAAELMNGIATLSDEQVERVVIVLQGRR
ncbi:hypothetical protein [Mycobacterium sp. Z3061]|uniref:hypothetical protein n=1 Tax=Mycobacterium sp. Z3061 TaxID=3073562 RepID=UPI0028738BC7|nr:hypothetical protein [Mycobacterium sp. Z3061]